MRVWLFTVALFLGMVTWAVDTLDSSIGPDQQTVTAMEDPLGPPHP
jgi:hypothetical protein